MGLSCEYMQSESNVLHNYLTCFFIINVDNSFTLGHYFFEVSRTSFKVSTNYYYAYIDYMDEVKQIKVITNNNCQKSLVCLLYANSNLKCYKFHLLKGWARKKAEFYQELNTVFICRNALYGMKLDNLVSPENITLSCINNNALVQTIIFDTDLGSQTSIQQFDECETIYGHSVLYSKKHSDYYVISDAVCNGIKKCFEPVNGEISRIEEVDIDQPSEVPENSNEVEKEKEKEKEKEEKKEEGKETEKEKEKDEKKEKEKEAEKAKENLIEKETGTENENERESENEKEINIDCSALEKCSQCDKDSFDENLCTECNQGQNYYYLNYNPSEPKPKNINCVNEATKPFKFYFNEENQDYEPCFSTCASCDSLGNYEDNKCTSCDGINYIRDPQDENSSNCVIKCKYLYYIEHGIYKCTESQACPKEFPYIIKEKAQCTDNCKDDMKYKSRYNGVCFEECPSNTRKDNEDFLCKDI